MSATAASTSVQAKSMYCMTMWVAVPLSAGVRVRSPRRKAGRSKAGFRTGVRVSSAIS